MSRHKKNKTKQQTKTPYLWLKSGPQQATSDLFGWCNIYARIHKPKVFAHDFVHLSQPHVFQAVGKLETFISVPFVKRKSLELFKEGISSPPKKPLDWVSGWQE